MSSAARWNTAVVIGKFYPPHRGHHYLIDTALAESQTVHVLVCYKPSQTIPGSVRAAWLRTRHPQAIIHEVPDTLGDDDTMGWAAFTIDYLGFVPDVVFSSEHYGEPFAQAMGCQHVLVDLERTTIPCSGTLIRSAALENLQYLEPMVRAWYAHRICLVGAESSGKTTLAQALAAQLGCDWMPEYGREYCLQKFGPTPMAAPDADPAKINIWTSEEFLTIAQEHARREDELAGDLRGLLVVDTDAFATCLWHERYLATLYPKLEQFAEGRRQLYDLYVLCDIDIPFEQDGTRDGQAIRTAMQQRFIQRLQETGRPWILASGSLANRLETVLSACAQNRIEPRSSHLV